jgi:hypothetical protein
VKGLLSGQWLEAAGKGEFTLMKGALQASHELAPKDTAQHLHGQEERVMRMDPTLVAQRQAPRRDHAVNVRVMLKILAPGVEHAQKADFRSEMFGVDSHLQQGRGAKRRSGDCAQKAAELTPRRFSSVGHLRARGPPVLPRGETDGFEPNRRAPKPVPSAPKKRLAFWAFHQRKNAPGISSPTMRFPGNSRAGSAHPTALWLVCPRIHGRRSPGKPSSEVVIHLHKAHLGVLIFGENAGDHLATARVSKIQARRESVGPLVIRADVI